MRLILATLLALLPLAAPQAAVVVNANFNGQQINCTNASGISQNLGTNTFKYTCDTNNVTRTCTPTQNIAYSLSTLTITVTCTGGTEQGLVVDATIDGSQNGNGLGGKCLAATNFGYDLNTGEIGWTCGAQAIACYPLSDAQYDLVNTQVTLVCSETAPLIFRHGFDG